MECLQAFALPDIAQPVNIDVVQSREVEVHLDGQELMESSLVVEDRLNLLLVHNRCLFLFHLLSVVWLSRALFTLIDLRFFNLLIIKAAYPI